MTLQNAIKKLNKNGFAVESVGNMFSAAIENGKDVIEFFRNGGSEEVTCISVRRKDDESDSMRDYCAGCFVDNISQAIRIAQ
jgi:hypothetical protein